MERRHLWLLTSAIGVVVVLGICAVAGLWYLSGGRVLSVATGSMSPLIKPGDAVLVHKIDSANIQIGNIVSYPSAANPTVPITHRVIAKANATTLTTRGDALKQADPPVQSGQVMGQVVAVAPKLGTILVWLRKPYILAALIYTPVAMIAIMELRRLQGEWRVPTYMHSRRAKA